MSSNAVRGLNAPSSVRGSVAGDFSYKITAVKDPKTGKPLTYTINSTMMRIELPVAIKTGQSYAFRLIGTTLLILRPRWV